MPGLGLGGSGSLRLVLGAGLRLGVSAAGGIRCYRFRRCSSGIRLRNRLFDDWRYRCFGLRLVGGRLPGR
ncbi:hypothetical protein OKW32_001840 [Paraburkholderia youngii]